ncbi:zinc finger CCCH domain-containing protein 28 isoform X2 [Oryza glaberrima]|uniref:zinc finger CCCH domain-containing protein 28 isoform X2 n=1 Tax=Oryza glaberrima TaxID=4538 RepID=UPI00224C5FFD|nr:zinc finger CCCH domain-containing protein 28 isoform X2 [Oryza glaberrima]
MASAETPNPDAEIPNTGAAAAAAAEPAAAAATTDPAAAGSPSPPLPPRKRRLSPTPSPTRRSSRSRSRSRSRSPRRGRSRSRSRSRSRGRSASPRYPDGKRRRHNDLNVEVCRDFLRDRCARADIECKYAHPHPTVAVDRDSKVTACADSLRNNCFRGRTCRYYHPPPHIQESLLRSIGVEDPKVKMVCRDFTRGRCSRSANECRFLHHSPLEDCAIVCQDFLRGRCDRKSCRYSHVMAHPMPPPMRDIPMQYPDMVYMPPPAPLGVPMMMPPPSAPAAFSGNNYGVEVCRDYLKNMCNRESCRFAHPDLNNEVMNTQVEVCRDFKRGECNRPACRFYHPPASSNSIG